jgi:hypothetical protein
VTGDRGFAETYMLTQKIEAGATTTTVTDDKDPTRFGESVTFTASVAHTVSRGGAPTGAVQFSLDGSAVGKPVELDSNGRATWTETQLKPGDHRVTASYMPSDNALLSSTSLDQPHTVSTGEVTAEVERRIGRLEEKLDIISEMLKQLLER